MRASCCVAVLALAACSADTGSDKAADSGTSAACAIRAVVTDIDETLTTTDGEWWLQLDDPSHDPAMRPEADALLQDYAGLGYSVAYVTARGEDMALSDGTTARDATQAWLDSHGFPAGELRLASGIGALGSAAVEYKAAALAELQDAGWTFDYGYGNAESDIEAFQLAGVGEVFLVGRLVGTMDGVSEVPDDAAYAAHRAAHLGAVPDATCD